MIYIHPNTQALIFDCDGTIADSMSIHNKAWQIIASRYQINLSSEKLAHFNGIPTAKILAMLTEGTDFKFDIPRIVNEKEMLAAENITEVLPIQPIIEVIKNHHGKIPMVVFSGGTRHNVIQTLKTLSLIPFFEFILTGDDDHPTKDNPDSFRLIANRLGVNCNRCHVFEDGKPGLINAVKANMHVTDVRTFYP